MFCWLIFQLALLFCVRISQTSGGDDFNESHSSIIYPFGFSFSWAVPMSSQTTTIITKDWVLSFSLSVNWLPKFREPRLPSFVLTKATKWFIQAVHMWAPISFLDPPFALVRQLMSQAYRETPSNICSLSIRHLVLVKWCLKYIIAFVVFWFYQPKFLK